MPKVALLAMDGCYASSLTGFMDLLLIANAHAKKQLGDSVDFFQWTILSIDGKSITASGGLPIAVESDLSHRQSFDLIYIPGVYYGGGEAFSAFLRAHAVIGDWLRHQWDNGSILTANCTGIFLVRPSWA